ncbi:MAG: tetratricopeptide repeat protein [Myxococcaceae bacterium]
MRVTCPTCKTQYNVDDQRIPPGGAKLKCAKCQGMFQVSRTQAPLEDAIPLPGTPVGAAVPLPGVDSRARASWNEESRRVVASDAFAIPMPGASSPAAPPPAAGSGMDDLFGDLEGDSPEPATAIHKRAPPIEAFREFPPPAPPAPPPPPMEDFGLDFGSPDPQATSSESLAPPPPPQDDAWPEPEGFSAVAADSGDDIPQASDLDFAEVSASTSSVQKNPLLDFELPAPAAPPDVGVDFGGVDFGEAPAASEPLDFGMPGELPDSPAVASTHAMPPPPPAVEADGLAMLDFIDGAGGGTASKEFVRRFHVRRRSGKIFGPFEEGVVLKMMEDGQLQGNEDVSLDGETWAGIGTEPAFSDAMARLLDKAPAETGARAATRAPALDRLKEIYEGRHAAMTGGRSGKQWLAFLQSNAIKFGVPAALGVVLALGLSLGLTRYGVFAHKKLFPAEIRRGSAEAKVLEEAHGLLLTDTLSAYKDARDGALRVLKKKEYPELRAIWCQATFYLQRRYGAASATEVAVAQTALESISLLGEKHPEVVKARAGAALSNKNPDEALAVLQSISGRVTSESDLELLLLQAESHVAKNQSKLATDVLKKAQTRAPQSAKTLHMLGDLAQRAGQADDAVKHYSAAVASEARHVQSAVELAAIEILLHQRPAEGLAALDAALTEKTRNEIGPSQLARAYALRGVALEQTFRPKDAQAELEKAKTLDPNSGFVRGALARVLVSQRQHAAALPLLKDLLAAEPQNLEATESYLLALVALGKMNDALNVVNAATNRFPGNARLAYVQGQVNEALERNREAESHYQRAISADPKLYDAHLALARYYLKMRRTADAEAQVAAALSKAPEDARVRIAVGDLALQSNDLTRAKEEFSKAASLNPALPDAPLGLSRAAFEAGDLPLAKTKVEEALALDGQVKDGHLQKGLVLWKLLDLPGAVTELEAAKLADPASVRVATLLAAVKLDQNDLPGAEAGLRSALSTDPTYAEAHYYLARVKSRRAEHTQAIDSMRTALEREPKRIAFMYEMGIVFRDAGKLAEAIEAWKKTLAVDPNHLDTLEALGAGYLDRGRVDDAVSTLKHGLSVAPDRARMNVLLGDCHAHANKWPEAIAAYQTALKYNSKDTTVFFKIGRAYTEENKHGNAIEWYQRAIAADATNPMPYYHLGYALKERARKKDAIFAFKAYLARKPDATDKKDVEEEIYDLEQTR